MKRITTISLLALLSTSFVADINKTTKVWLQEPHLEMPEDAQTVNGRPRKWPRLHADNEARYGWLQGQRFWIEHAFHKAKSQLGMAQYQVRVWQGWHHHMTLGALPCC